MCNKFKNIRFLFPFTLTSAPDYLILFIRAPFNLGLVRYELMVSLGGHQTSHQLLMSQTSHPLTLHCHYWFRVAYLRWIATIWQINYVKPTYWGMRRSAMHQLPIYRLSFKSAHPPYCGMRLLQFEENNFKIVYKTETCYIT